MILGSIDVTLIEKHRIVEGKPRDDGRVPKYIDIVITERKEPDQYGNTHLIALGVSKEERRAKIRGAIIGKGRLYERPRAARPNAPARPEANAGGADDDVPF